MPSILVIDDDDDLRTLLRLLLESAGHQVREAPDGPQGVRTYAEHRPDLVLCDLLMPGEDGLGTIRRLRSEFPGVRVVAMSGGGDLFTANYLPGACALGVTATLSKPFGKGALLETVSKCLAW